MSRDRVTITKRHIASDLKKNEGMSSVDAVAFVDNFFNEVTSTLCNGSHVKISGFGNFFLRDRGERVGRNFRTGGTVTIAPRRAVAFRPGQTLRQRSFAGQDGV